MLRRIRFVVLILAGLVCIYFCCNCSICKGECIEGGTIGGNCTKYWLIFNWWELLKVNKNNSADVWIKIVFELIKPFSKYPYYEIDLGLPNKTYNLEIYPKNTTSAGKYLSYIKSGNELILRINKSAVKYYRYYAVAIHYKIKKGGIITEKFIKLPIPLVNKFIKSPEISLRYGLDAGLAINELIPKKIREDKNAVTVNFFVVLPNNTVNFHVNMPKMLVIPPRMFNGAYKMYFTKWVRTNYKNCKLPFKINIGNTQPVLYYVSGGSPKSAKNYPFHEIYVEYTVTNYPIVWTMFFATLFGLISTLIGTVLGFRKIFNIKKQKSK